MIKFAAKGHPNIRATHKTTLEFTKDKEVTVRGDCIVGVGADFDLKSLKSLLTRGKKVKLVLSVGGKREEVVGEINPGFNSDKELVVRKSSYVSERTLVINSDKAAVDLDREFVKLLKKASRVEVTIYHL